MNINPWLFLSDIDGTLIKRDQNMPSDICKAFLDLKKHNCIVSLCTGRSICEAKKIVNEIDVNAPCILYGGGMVYDYKGENILWSKAINGCHYSFFGLIFNLFSDIHVCIYEKQCAYILSRTSFAMDKFPMFSGYPIKKNIGITDVIYRICIVAEKIEMLQNIKRRIDKIPDLACRFTGRNFLEITDAMSSKEQAFRYLVKILGIPIERTFAMGDSEADISLLRTVKHGYFVGTNQEINCCPNEITCLPKYDDGGSLIGLQNALRIINGLVN